MAKVVSSPTLWNSHPWTQFLNPNWANHEFHFVSSFSEMEEANCSEFVKSLFPFQFIPQPPASYSSPKPKLRARSCPSSLCKAQVWENVQCTLYIYVRGLKQLLHPMGPRLPLYPTPVWILRRLDTRRYKEHTFCNFIAIQMSFLTSIWQGLLSVINCYTSDMFCTFNPYKNLSIVVGLP